MRHPDVYLTTENVDEFEVVQVRALASTMTTVYVFSGRGDALKYVDLARKGHTPYLAGAPAHLYTPSTWCLAYKTDLSSYSENDPS